jgi:hypothetical protein
MPSLDTFIEALIQEQDKLIKMGVIKNSKAHALVVHDGNSSQNQKSKVKGKTKSHAESKKEGYSKPFNDSSGSKSGKGKKGQKCTYCNRGFHPESACMKKQIDLMTQILQKNNLGDQIPEGAKKKPEDHAPKGNHHALVVVHSSPDAWIMDSGASHHMAATQDILSSLTTCNGPPILMGDDSPIEVSGKGRVELDHGSFENVLHVPQNFHESSLSVSYYTLRLRKKGGVHTRLCVHIRHARQLQDCCRGGKSSISVIHFF